MKKYPKQPLKRKGTGSPVWETSFGLNEVAIIFFIILFRQPVYLEFKKLWKINAGIYCTQRRLRRWTQHWLDFQLSAVISFREYISI